MQSHHSLSLSFCLSLSLLLSHYSLLHCLLHVSQRYTITMDFVGKFERQCGSQASVKRLRVHPSYVSFNNKWNLPVYFQLRWVRCSSFCAFRSSWCGFGRGRGGDAGVSLGWSLHGRSKTCTNGQALCSNTEVPALLERDLDAMTNAIQM